MKKSKLLLVSWILSALYFVYLVVYFSGAIGGSTGSEQIGASLAGMLVMPHALLVLLGLIFNILGWSMNKRGFALTGAILYAVSMVLFIPYFFFVLVQTILSFIGFAKLKK
jgi:hypothetical protein